MARDSFNEQKNKNVYSTKKKKKKQTTKTVVKKPQSSSVSKETKQEQRITQKTYGQPTKPAYKNNKAKTAQKQQTVENNTRPTQTVARQSRERTADTSREMMAQRSNATTTAAQRQKMGVQTKADEQAARDRRRQLGNSIKSSVRDSMSEDNRSFAQRQKSGTMTAQDEERVKKASERRKEVARNTGAAVKKATLDTVSGYGQTLADVDEMAKSNRNWTTAKAQKMGIDLNDRARVSKVEQERQQSIREAREFQQELFDKQEQRQAEWDERTKNAKGLEKAWYGAVESGTGMLLDTAVGAATGTGQFGSLASMGLRTYGSSANQARKEGATDKEARLYGLASAGKEMGTELMFQGAGLAKAAYGKTGLSLADKSANILTKGLTGLKADAVGAGVRALGGTAEENVEELAGWMADPIIKELTYGKNVRNRMKENLRANIPQIGSDADAANVASYFSTPQFTDELTSEYVKSGLSKEQASELAAEMRDYYVAYYSGDNAKLDALETDLAAKLSGQDKLSTKSWSMDELKDTFASTTLLTLATGIPGAVNTSVKGNRIFDSDEVKAVFGDDAVRKVADAVKNTSDKEMSLKAETMKDRLDSGKDLTGTQKYDLYQGYLDKVNETAKKATASYGVVENAREEQDLVPTMGRDRTGNTVYAKATQREFNEKFASTELTVEALKNYMESDNSISDDESRRANAVKKAVADIHVGGLTVGDAHEFAYGNTLAREALKAEEGIDLDQYIVRNADGTVDLSATNEATENALFQINADNAIKAAQVETEVFKDDYRGDIDRDVMSRFGNNGQAIWKEVNKDLDPRDLQNYLTTANAASYFYSAGRNTDMGVDEAVNRYADTFKTVDNSVLKRAYAAGARDRIIANTPGYGQTVESGSNIQLKKTKPIITGQLIMDKDVVIPDSDQSAYLALAMSTNTNIHIVSSLKSKQGVEINGMSHGNDIYLNVNAAAESNLGYVFMHEMTHQIKQYAPNEYLALENLVRDRWFNKDQKGMQKAIKDRIDLYSTKGGQQLTEEEAVEEIIADAMAEAMDDPDFAAQVCEEDINLGQAILNSIREALRSIRNMFASTEFKNDRFHNSLLSYLGILDEAEKMWLNALATAKQNKANGLIADWQDRANKQNSPRLSVGEGKYSITPQQDADYMTAVESGDMRKAQSLVEDAAIASMPNIAKNPKYKTGRVPLKLYHGTPSFGFTHFKDSNYEVPFIYTSTDNTVSAHYAGDHNYASPRQIGKPYREGNSTEDIIENAKTVWDTDLKKMSTEEKKARYNEVKEEASKVADKIDELYPGYWQADEATDNAIAWVEDLFFTIRDGDYSYNFDEDDGERGVANEILDDSIRMFKENIGKVKEYRDEHYKDLEEGPKALLNYLCGYDVGDAAIDIEYGMQRVSTEEDRLVNVGGSVSIPSDLKKALDQSKGIGAYTLYGDLGENPLEFDADGAQFWAVKVPQIGDEYMSTDQICKWAYKNGYTSVIMHNIYDYGDKADNYVFFNSSQLKSADPVTYDDDGKPIPLSERFNTENEDIRYSLTPEQQRDVDYMNAVNSNNMDEAQRLVDEAAKMAGYTTKAYHGTGANFTVFDKDKSGKNYRGHSKYGKGLYFADSIDQANRWGKNRNVLKTYLDLKNPYVVPLVAEEGDILLEEYNKYKTAQDARLKPSKEEPGAFLFEMLNEMANDKGYTTKYLQGLGYDGVIAEHGAMVDMPAWTEYVAFDSEQIKSADPVTYAEDGSVIPLSERFDPTNNDIRYSLPTQDSDGNILTDGQMEYFKNSQARDEQGRLIPMYHVTPVGGFTVFDPSYSFDETSISFSNSLDFALNYSSDDGNPGDWETAAETRLGDVETEDDQIGHYKVYLKMDNPLVLEGDYLDEMDIYEWPVYAKANGYDGVVYRDFDDGADIYQVFSSNQIKDTRNENPTENPDIRYSIATRDEVSGYLMQNAESITDIPLQDARLEENRIRYSLDATNFENSIIASWDRRKRNLAEEVQETPLKNELIRLMKQVRKGSGTDRKYSTETIDETIRSLKKMYYYAKGDKAKDFAREAWDAAERIVGDINYNDVQYLHYKGISSYFADTEIHVPEELIDDDTFIQFAKNNAGRIRLFADEGIEIEEAWKSLHDAYPDLFPRAAFVADSPVGMLIQMDWVLNQLEPYKEAYTSEEHSKLVEDIANTLCSIVEEGNEYNATVNDLNVRAMRQRHSEALRKVQEQEKQKRDNQKERAEKWKQKYLERVEKNKADKEAGKQKKNETKLVGDIEKNIKWLSDRLRPETRTKDNAIPEQFRSALGALLAEFDLQSKGSKKIEKKKGYPSKTTLKLKQLREQYAAIAKENDDDGNNVFRYNGDLLVKMDELIKTMESLDKFFDKRYGREVTIADLSLSEMFIIDTMLKSLVHEFREYKNVTINSKRAEIADVSSEVIGDMDTQIGRHGAAREGGALGKINGLLNMSEVTPIYFFKRLGAMYKMYRELRKGFDKYIENDREVINRLSEIMSGYYNKKNPGTTIESWRTTEDAQTFNFEHGPVTLSVAQMMEVYLYANRPQAFGHMIGDGIIVTPISPVGKIETAKEKLLGHEPMVDPVRLTYENVQEIISKLSEEQVNMANKLQELVAGYMSDLGNETTMKLYGYKMFDDPNYFGIHVSQTATNSSVDAPAITETIKNFGWTKPLTPGAKNTIVIGDIFTDVARYCNEMNQFNAYAVPVSDFMRVYNYTLRDENGELQGSAKSAIIKAFGKQAHTYIMNFLRDLNGSSMRRNGGLEGMIDAALGRAKKAAVFMNMRVALQQPTAIVRALAQVNARYFVGVRPSATATKEMIEHCPIAQWKAWGFYDTHFGRDVEDLIMNNWSKADVVGSWIYGALDNMTWGMIWQAVKNEVDADIKKRGLDIKKGSQEYWDMCNDRASEVFDSTQVVDSPFHRSDAMRSKDTLVKQFTSFQAEPTLSFNVIRDFAVQAYDAVADGDKTKAAKLIAKGVEVWTLQAAVVAVAQSLWDAVRHKDPDGDDDEDEGFLQLWWQNFMADFVDDMKFYNNIYFLKEFTPYAEKLVDYMKTGKWDTYDSNKLLMFQGAEKMTQGLQQLIKKIQKGDEYKHKNGEPYTWYEVMTNFLGGVGYLTGMPIGTVMRDAQSILKWFHINAFAADGSENTDKRLADAIAEKMGYQKAGSSSDKVASEATSKKAESDKDESADNQADIEQKVADYRESLSDNFTDEEKDELVKQYEKRIKKGVKSEEVADRDKDTMLFDAEKAAAGYEGTERDKRIWQSVSQGYKSHVESGDYAYIARMRSVVEQAGGNLDYFDEQIVKASKTALKKTIEPGGADTESEMVAQQNIRYYLQGHGVTQEEISSEIVYKCAAAKDLKVAFRLGDEQAITESSYPLLFAGLTTTDYEKLYTNRNRMDLSKYDGKYKDRLKSTGTFVWPTQGTITSHFGARNAPTRGASSNHPAIDIGAPKGTPVVAADGGVVIYAGTNGGYGNSVGIKHDNGMVTYYNHLSAWNVNVGDTVGQGQQIANVGSTGISTGPHLDFKILDTNGKPVDPEMYLNKRS